MISTKMYNFLVQLERGYLHTTARHIRWPREERHTLQAIALEAEDKGYVCIRNKKEEFDNWWITIVEDGAAEIAIYEFEYYKAYPPKRKQWSLMSIVSMLSSLKNLLKK